jgi:predicted DNA-binding protein
MQCIGRTFVRLSAENRLRLDRFRRHQSLTRDRIVNDIVADYLNRLYTELRLDHVLRRRRRAA